MFERYSEGARRVVFFARYEASQLGSPRIESEHLLLGVLREPGAARAVLADVLRDSDAVRAEIERRLGPSDRPPTSHEIPLSSACREALSFAAEEANRMKHAVIEPAHLVLGLLRTASSFPALLLQERGVTLDDARRELPADVGDGGDLRLRLPDILDSHRAGRVRIWPTAKPEGGMDEGGVSHWLLEGFTLRAALSRACGLSEARIQLPAALDDGQRYDFLVTGEVHDDRHRRDAVMLKGIERHFNITTEREKRPTDVYVMTAPDGLKIREVDEQLGGFAFIAASVEVPGPVPPRPLAWSEIGPLSGPAPIDVLCQLLSVILGRPVINETGLSGTYEFELPAGTVGIQAWSYAFEEKTGLRLSADVRDTDVLIVRSRD